MPDIFVAEKKVEDKAKKEKSPEVKEPRADKLKGLSNHKLLGHSHNPLSAFSYYPDHVNFATQDSEEKVILLLRKHPITNLRWVLIAMILIIAPLFLSAIPTVDLLPARFQAVVFVSWYLLVLAYIFERFLSWFFNFNIVTDERIIDVDFVNLVYREITDANIDKIQDVTVQVGSVTRTLFNYGNVVIQTAAEIPQMEFEAVPNPDRVSRILRDLRVEEEQEKLEGRVR